MELTQLTNEELELLIYETQETHDNRFRTKLLKERERRNKDD